MPIQHYHELQTFINDIMRRNISSQTNRPELEDALDTRHGAFWNLPYNDFINGNVPKVKDPDTGLPMRILIPGSSAQSNIILALKGAPGSPFDPETGNFTQMPADGPPMFTDAEIAEIADWIDRGCPE